MRIYDLIGGRPRKPLLASSRFSPLFLRLPRSFPCALSSSTLTHYAYAETCLLAVVAQLATILSAAPGAVQAFVSVTCAGKDVTEVEQLAALKALQVCACSLRARY